MGLTIFEETFGTERVRFGKVSKREANAEHLAAITSAVQKVVDTFRDPNTGQRFIVGLSANTEAWSDPTTKRIVVSYKPIYDKGLKVSTVCTVMTGLVLHEIGHTLYTFPNHATIIEAFGTPGTYVQKPGSNYSWETEKGWDQLAWTMLNIGDDARLEARMVENLPVAAGIFPTMLHWVAITSGMVGEGFRWKGKGMPMSDRVNFAGRSVRYPWTARWATDANTRSERAWWVNWGAEYIALDDRDADGMVALIKTAVERLRNAEDLVDDDEEDDEPTIKQPKMPPGPGPEPQRKPGVEDEDDDEPDENPQPGEGKGEPFGDDFDKDEDADSDDEDADEDEDEDGEDGDDFWDDSEDADDDESDEDEPGPGADDDETEPGESKVDAPTGSGKDEAGDKDGEPDDTKPGEGKVGGDEKEREASKFPQDFDAHNLKGNVDAMNRNEDDYRAQNESVIVQRQLDSVQSTERVTTLKWGAARVEVRSMEQFMQRTRR